LTPPGLLYKLIKLNLSANTIKLINSFLSNRKYKVSVEGELSTPKEIQAGVPQGSVLSPLLYNLHINDGPQTPGTQLALFADDTCIYATDRKGFTIRKLQRGLTAMEAWCERWNIKINEDTRSVQKVSDLWSAKIQLFIWMSETLIPFKVVSLVMHTLLPAVLPLLETFLESFLWNHVQLGCRFPHNVFS
jgi:hypothetical protein